MTEPFLRPCLDRLMDELERMRRVHRRLGHPDYSVARDALGAAIGNVEYAIANLR